LAFTLDVERDPRISIAIGANTRRALDRTGVRLRDLPRRAGVSREATAMCTGWPERRGRVVAHADAAGRGKVLRLSGRGERALRNFRDALAATEESWRAGVRQRSDTLPHYPMVLHRGGCPDGS
jgi:hypothetical protein